MSMIRKGLTKFMKLRVAETHLWTDKKIEEYDSKLAKFEKESQQKMTETRKRAVKADKLMTTADDMEFDIAALSADKKPREILHEVCKKLGDIHRAYPTDTYEQDMFEVGKLLRQTVGIARNGQGYAADRNTVAEAESAFAALRGATGDVLAEIRRIRETLGKIVFRGEVVLDHEELRGEIAAKYNTEPSKVEKVIQQKIDAAGKEAAELMKVNNRAEYRLGHDRIILNFFAGNIMAQEASLGIKAKVATRVLNQLSVKIMEECSKPMVDEHTVQALERQFDWQYRECNKCLEKFKNRVCLLREDSGAKLVDYLLDGTMPKMQAAIAGVPKLERKGNIFTAEVNGSKQIDKAVSGYEKKIERKHAKLARGL